MVARERSWVSGWDEGLNFDETQHYLILSYRFNEKPTRCHDMILLIQLADGARVNTVLCGLNEDLKSGSTAVEVSLFERKGIRPWLRRLWTMSSASINSMLLPQK